ncbi:hypothetical protein N656DRAFT_774091 [Canariomyces notabilis]|uniref:Uncharacterized protein n=1 Tax=Canariomyces notabilis TaxID=2074819 RepID=A0AAN6TNU3_9PEZI|nr:hypothetical protein N656DRAFT_774091 [Canariomyces arenarius]
MVMIGASEPEMHLDLDSETFHSLGGTSGGGYRPHPSPSPSPGHHKRNVLLYQLRIMIPGPDDDGGCLLVPASDPDPPKTPPGGGPGRPGPLGPQPPPNVPTPPPSPH